MKRTTCALIVLIIANLCNGCVTHTYKVGDVSFSTRVAAEQEHARQLNQTIGGILPTSSAVGGRTLVAIPSLDHIDKHGIKITGNRANLSQDQIEYIKRTEMNARESIVAALQKRQIFTTTTLVHSDDPQSTSLSDFDFLIYLHNPSPDLAQWYLTSRRKHISQPIVMDMGKPTGLPRTIAWLDSIESLARADYSHRDMAPMSSPPGIAKTALDTIKVVSYQYNAKTQKGVLSVDISGHNFEEARNWVVKNIGGICSSKEVLMEAGQEHNIGGRYRVHDEFIKNGILTVEFTAGFGE